MIGSVMEFELRRAPIAARLPRAMALLGLVALLLVAVWFTGAMLKLHEGKAKLQALERDLAERRSRQVLVASAPSPSIVEDAWNAASVLQTGWADRLLEVERCASERVRVVRLGFSSPGQRPTAIIEAQAHDAIEEVVECLNAAGQRRAWVVTQIRVGSNRGAGAMVVPPMAVGTLEWRK
jgi:hypothetical protein